jgi:hypothetical protein
VTVANPDILAPLVSLTTPTAGSVVAGTVTVTAAASDAGSPTVPASGVAGVQFQLDGSNLGVEISSAPYSMAWNTRSAANGVHTLLARARDAAGNVAVSSVSITVNNLIVKINFQPSNAAVPSGYLKDSGTAYGNRGNGYSYGWNATNNRAVDRNSSLSPDQRYDTLNTMQTGGTYRWEIALASGRYRVHVVAGDATATNSVYKINAESTLAVSGTPTSSKRWIEGTVDVNVTDGRLTLSNATGASNDKICFVDIERIGPAGSGMMAALPADGAFAAAAPPAAGTGSKAKERFLSPSLADGINDAAVFGPDAQSVLIMDVNGRVVFEAERASDLEPLAWDARDHRGGIVDSGVYLARIREKGGALVSQIFVVAK